MDEIKKVWKLIKVNDVMTICHDEYDIPPELINKRNEKPIILIPVTHDFCFIVIERRTRNGFILNMKDIRYIESQWISSIEFKIKGNRYDLESLKKSIEKSRNKATNCMGLSYFFRKLNYGGFTNIAKPFNWQNNKHKKKTKNQHRSL